MNGAYCASPICVPSRMSAITGRYPFENEVWTNGQILNSAIPTYAHALGAAGYRSVQIGRMHFNGVDQHHGFTLRLVGDHSPNWSGSPRPVDHGELHGTAGPARVSLEKSGPGQSAYEVHDEAVANAAEDYIAQLVTDRRQAGFDGPISLSIGLMLPHQPFVARPRDFARYEGRVGRPTYPAEPIESCHPYIRWWRSRTGIQTVTEAEIIRSRTAYWALVDRMDAIIGRILTALGSAGLMNNTLVIYTSDHGDQLGEHGLWWKQTFYEASARVPAIISWPGTLPEGQVLDRVINQFDLTATMLEAAGAPAMPRSHGRSLLELLKDPESTPWDDVAFSEYCMNDEIGRRATSPNLGGRDVHARPGGVQNRMVRSGAWKLNYYHGHEPQLFNLEEDPGETKDLSGDSAFAGTKSELVDRVLDGWNPEWVKARMRVLKQEQIVMQDWAANTDPDDVLRWNLRPQMDFLDKS